MPHRLTLLLTSPRMPAGLLTRDAWTVLAQARQVLARDGGEPAPDAVLQAGMPVAHLGDLPAGELARLLLGRAGEADIVWVGSADGDPGLTDALAAEVSRSPQPPEIEVLVGSWDPPGARLLDVVAVMDLLRSPGGCPWDAEQTHESLVPYLLEEAHEAVEAIESGDRDHMVEELGDVLLQVAFQARVGSERPAAPFDVDEVAAGVVDKLVRRHPHVFAADDRADGASVDDGGSAVDGPSGESGAPLTAADVAASWERVKAAEKPHRTSVSDGIPPGLPPLSRADKVIGRLEHAGQGALALDAAGGEGLGARLLALVLQARADGQDAPAALRATLRELERRAGPGQPD